MFACNQTIIDVTGLKQAVIDASLSEGDLQLLPFGAILKQVMFGYLCDVYEFGGYFMDAYQEVITTIGPKRMVDVYKDHDSLVLADGSTMISPTPYRLGRMACYSFSFDCDIMYSLDTNGLLFQGREIKDYADEGQGRDFL